MPKPLPPDAWVVYHVIHVRTPHQHIGKLLVTDVPEGKTEDDVKSALTRNGYSFSEFHIPWANHALTALPDAPDEVVGAYRRGDVFTIPWAVIAE
jgi:hypothetical protein